MKQLGYDVESINFSTDEFSTAASRDSSVASPTTTKKMKHSEDVSHFFNCVKISKITNYKNFLQNLSVTRV